MPVSGVNIDVAEINIQTMLCLIYLANGKTFEFCNGGPEFRSSLWQVISQSPSKFSDGLPSLRLHDHPIFLSGFPFVDFGIVLYLQGKIFIHIYIATLAC